jgi:amino acid transporter
MALNHYLPASLLQLNRYGIPTKTLWINACVGLLSFLPFPGWPSMVAFLSSCSILSYGVGPICLLALRKINPSMHRPFHLGHATILSYLAFYAGNLMLIWCGFTILWKLALAITVGLLFQALTQWKAFCAEKLAILWFSAYLGSLLFLSYWSSFGGRAIIPVPVDMMILLPISVFFLQLSTKVCLSTDAHATSLNHVRQELC